MAYRTIVGDLQAVTDQLNGSIILGPFPESGLDVNGKTLDFTSPGVEVTFAEVEAGRPITITEIVTQIQTVLGGINEAVVVRRPLSSQGTTTNANRGDPMVVIVIYNDAIIIGHETSTAAADFKLTSDKTGAAVLKSSIIGFGQGSTTGHYVVLIGEE